MCVAEQLRMLTSWPSFQRDERVLIVWSHDLENIISTCHDFEDKLIKLVWNRRSARVSTSSINMDSSDASSEAQLAEKTKEHVETKEVPDSSPQTRPKDKKKRFWGLAYWVTDKRDIEKTAEGPSPRPVRLVAPIYNGLGVAMSICKPRLPLNSTRLPTNSVSVFIASGVSIMFEESLLDGNWSRFALLVTTPFLFCVSLVRSADLRSISVPILTGRCLVLLPAGHQQRLLRVR